MLVLELRDEFKQANQPETAIVLRHAAEQAASHILEIAYPTADIPTALRVIALDRPQRPLRPPALIGGRCPRGCKGC